MRVGDLLASALFIVVKYLAIDVRLRTAFFDEHILDILTDEQNLTFWKSTSASTVNHSDLLSNAAFTKDVTQIENLKTHFKEKTIIDRKWNTRAEIQSQSDVWLSLAIYVQSWIQLKGASIP